MHIKLSIILILTCLFSFQAQCAEIQPSEIFINRHSGKNYDPSRIVTDDQIMTLIEATRWSPSSFNDQPWNYIICDREKTPEAYSAALSSIMGTQKNWAMNASHLIIIVVRPLQLYKDKPNAWAEYDTGASAMSLSLQATDLGLMTHQIGGFEQDLISEFFHLPKDFKPVALMTLGYEVQEQDPNVKPRIRRPIEENFFLGEWGHPFK